MQGGDVALIGGAAAGVRRSQTRCRVSRTAALFDVVGVRWRGHVLAKRGLADVEHGQQGAELDLADGVQCRADPQPDRGVNQVVEPVLGRRCLLCGPLGACSVSCGAVTGGRPARSA